MRTIRQRLRRRKAVYPFLRFLYQTYWETYYRLLSRFRRASGVSAGEREMPVVVSLTTIPERLHKVHLSIESLFLQSVKPDRVILWVSDGLREEDITPALNRQRRRGLEIRFCRDVGPLTKIIHALREYHGTGIIVTADDDHFYMKNWLRQLYQAYVENPECIHCHRAYQMKREEGGGLLRYDDWELIEIGSRGPSLSLFPTGVGGVLYPPGSLDEAVHDEDLFLRLCPTADDIWLKAMSLRRGTACMRSGDFSGRAIQIRGVEGKALKARNLRKRKNDEQLEAVFRHFDLLDALD
jgi:hypothetical protein